MKTKIELPQPIVLKVKNLIKHFQVSIPNHGVQTVHALNGISFLLREGESLGLVGESGCGKSTAARAILRLVEPTSGEVFYRNHDLLALKKNELRSLRKEIQIIFQDPQASLNSRKSIKIILEEPFDIHGL
ncbi:MAG: ATP-binding cassette domain-containing protein, partial [Nitrospina sp.]|nr:ATP-binding cassette domain-containing protein [Nitrospina sp.]